MLDSEVLADLAEDLDDLAETVQLSRRQTDGAFAEPAQVRAIVSAKGRSQEDPGGKARRDVLHSATVRPTSPTEAIEGDRVQVTGMLDGPTGAAVDRWLTIVSIIGTNLPEWQCRYTGGIAVGNERSVASFRGKGAVAP
jgi:hypothetical protein